MRVRASVEQGLCVRGSPTELREVVANIVKNALDATVERGIVWVTAARRDRTIRLTIRDSGCGMSDDVKARALEPFFTTKGERGTGLGLPLAAQIVERHGGSLEIESAVGSGTTVLVVLPSASSDSSEQHAANSARAVDESRRPDVLFVDDDPGVLEPVARCLEHAGLSVRRAASGTDALALLERHPPDLVLTDYDLGDMTGTDLARQALRMLPDLPIALMTGFASLLDRQRALDAGVDIVLSKPPDYAELPRQLRDLTRVGKRRRTLA
jgi:CheY-like chemotaxis protein/anti-sigma regulatory factor (Ser/Thr protein kinase)